MAKKAPSYFDFLDRYGGKLQARIGYPDLARQINRWRKPATEDPDDVGKGCREVIEKALKALIGDPGVIRTLKLSDMIDYAYDKHLIDRRLRNSLDDVRKIGDRTTRESLNVTNAEHGLTLLDEVLRELIVLLGIDEEFPSDEKVEKGSPFVIRTSAELEALDQRARLAAALSGNGKVEKEAASACKEAQKATEAQAESLEEIAGRIAKLREGVGSEGGLSDADAERMLDDADSLVPKLVEGAKAADSRMTQAEKRVEEILDEHDFIKRLLNGSGKATKEQMDVMAFPKTVRATTSILQVAGGAGTGKTLCLLSKLIKDLDPSQMQMLDGAPRKALFVCFNKNLVKYVEGLLANYPALRDRILVCNFDSYMNQLVKPFATDSSLKAYGNDVRYPSGYKIHYEGDAAGSGSLLAAAMSKVAAVHPDQAGTYYLDCSQAENVRWVKEEIAWLEGRYGDPSTANPEYLKVSRTGRGTKRRPDDRIRAVILEVWEAYRKELTAAKRYTIEQATNRLMESSSLPAYDAIAIDEVQDFSLRQIQLVIKLRATAASRVYISGDENQKIYQRDFTWKELDAGIKGHTITLEGNMRNAAVIRDFAERLIQEHPSREHDEGDVRVVSASEHRIVEELRGLLSGNRGETTALIGSSWKWQPILESAGLPAMSLAKGGGVLQPGLYLVGDYVCKGLEFDHVVIDYNRMLAEDMEGEKRLRYVHFTRARKSLLVCYDGTPPPLLKELYPDYL